MADFISCNSLRLGRGWERADCDGLLSPASEVSKSEVRMTCTVVYCCRPIRGRHEALLEFVQGSGITAIRAAGERISFIDWMRIWNISCTVHCSAVRKGRACLHMHVKKTLPVSAFIQLFNLTHRSPNPLDLFHVSIWKRANRKDRILKKGARWTNLLFSTFKAKQRDFLLTVEPVSNSLRLPIGTRGNTRCM